MEKDIFDNLIIFEMANNHQGNVEHGIRIIKEMGRLARKHNVRCAVKLQYRNLDTFIHPGYKGRKDIAHIPRFESTRLSYEMFSTLVEIIKKEEMIAFGDGHNDASMVEYAGVGVAMENAVQALKDIADEVTLSNEDDGIARSLYKHMPEIGDSL